MTVLKIVDNHAHPAQPMPQDIRSSPDGTVFFVADMTGGLVPNTLVWNGRSGGRTVGSGAYIYRIQGGGKTYTGTVVVAR